MKVYDNQPSLERLKEFLLQKDGWSNDRIDEVEFRTMVAPRVSSSGNAYEVEVIGVFEARNLLSAFSRTRKGSIVEEKDLSAVRLSTNGDTFMPNETERYRRAEADQRRKQAAKKDQILNDLVNAQCGQLRGYPSVYGTLNYYRYTKRGQTRYPNEAGCRFLVEHGVPLVFNPMGEEHGWTEEKQQRLEKDCESLYNEESPADGVSGGEKPQSDGGAIEANARKVSAAHESEVKDKTVPVRIKDLPDLQDENGSGLEEIEQDDREAEALISSRERPIVDAEAEAEEAVDEYQQSEPPCNNLNQVRRRRRVVNIIR